MVFFASGWKIPDYTTKAPAPANALAYIAVFAKQHGGAGLRVSSISPD